MASQAIIIEGLKKAYGKTQALRGVDLTIAQGEIVGFLGPNGAGKTTTIRCMLDMIRPDAGRISILGFDRQKDPVKVRSLIGYLPGELNMDSNLTVRGLLGYFSSLRGKTPPWPYIESLAERLQLDLNALIRNLSKGNKQKAGLIQALMAKPPLLLLDEPTSGLDPLMQQEVYSMLREVQKEGTTVFFSSHIIREVETIAQRIAIIRKGVIVEEAQPGRFVDMSLRRIQIRFKESVDASPLLALDGVTLIRKEDSQELVLQLKGDMEALIHKLADYPVADLQSEHLSLEEVFITYYRENGKEGDAS